MSLDPALVLLIRAIMALLFLWAALHKLDITRFQAVLAAYRVIPLPLVAATSRLVILVEVLLGIGWAMGIMLQAVAVASAVLLGTYAGAMAVNLVRGRDYIDCGCGFGTDQQAEQKISWALVARNTVLLIVAGLATLPVAARDTGLLDGFAVVTGTLALTLLYAAYNQLQVNDNAIRSWRKPARGATPS